MRPKDFWAMHPREFWWLADAKKPPNVYAGGLTETEVAELHDMMKEEGMFNG